MRSGGKFLAFLGVLLATCGPAAAEAVFEPFADVVCRVEAESAQILKQTLNDGTPGPMSAEVVATKKLVPWHGMGVQVRKLWKWDLAWQWAASGGKVLMLRHSHQGKWYEPAKKPSPCARLTFRVPRAGQYYLFMRAGSWCCGCQMLAFRIDGGPDRVLQEPLWKGWWGDGWPRWRSLSMRPSGLRGLEKLALPKPFTLAAGGHVLELVCATPLCAGVALDELAVARQFRLDTGQVERDRRTLLHQAVTLGNEEAVRIFLAHGADVNAKNADNKRGKTPLELADWHGRKEIARILLAHGATWRPALFAHVWAGDLGEVQRRVRARPDLVKARDTDGWTALHWAAKHECIKVAELLLASGAEVDARDDEGRTPLHVASRLGRLKAAGLLLASGAEIDAKGQWGTTPLSHATAYGRRDVAELLVNSGADVNTRDRGGWTPLHAAARLKKTEMAEYLLSKGADANAQSHSGSTPLHLAKAPVAALLLAYGADTEFRGEYGYTPIFRADAETTKLLLDDGADITVRDEDGDTPLHDAAWNDNPKKMKMLLDAGADVNVVTKGRWMLEDAAAVFRNKEMADLIALARAEADPKRHGGSALYWAVWGGDEKQTRALLDLGVDLNARDKLGRTPLIVAGWRGLEKLAALLIEKGADPKARDTDGVTPLHWAARHGWIGVAKRLLKRGADIHARDSSGRTPPDWAGPDIRRPLREAAQGVGNKR